MIHLMSFNSRYGTADDGDQRWERSRSYEDTFSFSTNPSYTPIICFAIFSQA